MNKTVIKRNFSRYAECYDKYSAVQNLCASRLIAALEADGFERILDIGCGTGNYTKLLREKFPEARIKAIDISERMIEVAGKKLQNDRIKFIAADGETANFNEQFDLIASNAVFQWFEDLEKALIGYKGLLSKDGVILFSIFGPLTLLELNESLKELFGQENAINSRSFIEKERIEKILKNLFREVKIEEKIYREKYTSLSGLLNSIRYTGTRGSGISKKRFWIPGAVNDLEDIYKKKFKDITATYQVFFCKGVNPHTN